MSERKDYYKTLELEKGASANEIKSAYRRLARKYHPDVNPDNPEAEEKFKQINEAYQVLSDPQKKENYDRFGTAEPGFGGGGGTVQTFEPYSLETLTVASVTSQEQMTLEISVDEQDIAKLHVGQEASVTVEALTGQSFPAAITSISNTGTNEGGSSKFTVKLTLSKSGEMLPGMNASAYLSLQSQTVTAIPVAALVEDGAKTIVYTGYDEKKETLLNPITVTTGVSDGEYVQILSGLTESDTVYYAYYDTLEDSGIPDLGLGF